MTAVQDSVRGVALPSRLLGRLALRPRARLLLPFALLLAGGLYAPTLVHWFKTDDILFLHAVRGQDALTYFRDALDFRSAPPAPEVRFYRPFHSAAFIGLDRLFGLEPFGYHAWSLLLHLVNVTLVWLVASKLTERKLVAGLAAALFAVHPAYVEAVTWVSNNNALMATAAGLTSFWCFINAEEAGERRAWWYAGSAVAYAAALLFHPETGMLIVVLAAYRALVVMADWRHALRWREWLDLVPFCLIAAAYLAIHSWMVQQDFLPQAGFFTLSWHIAGVYLAYLAMVVYPVPESQTVLHSAGHVLAGVALLLAMGALLVSTRSRPFVAAVPVLWLIAALLPLTTVDPDLSALYSVDAWGRKLYVAGPALAIVLALMAGTVFDRLRSLAPPAARLAAPAIAALALTLAGWLVIDRQGGHDDQAAEMESFITRLRDEHPTLAQGARLYVVNIPGDLLFFRGYYPYIVDLYYDGVETTLGAPPGRPRPNDVVFQYDAE